MCALVIQHQLADTYLSVRKKKKNEHDVVHRKNKITLFEVSVYGRICFSRLPTQTDSDCASFSYVDCEERLAAYCYQKGHL